MLYEPKLIHKFDLKSTQTISPGDVEGCSLLVAEENVVSKNKIKSK